jgi:predicted lipoprotein with Yx(FWY)xxD motif
MNRMTTMLVAACAVAGVLLAAGCGSSSGASGLYGSGKSSSAAQAGGNAGMYGSGQTSPSTATNAATAATLGVGKTGLGQVLVNSAGHTLYLFEKDQNGRSACEGTCAGYWPPLISKGQPMALRGLNQALVGETTRADGTKQVTYAGHPVYMFVQDTKAGQTNGEGLTDFGGAWDALSPSGASIEAGQSGAQGSGAQSSSTQSGGW